MLLCSISFEHLLALVYLFIYCYCLTHFFSMFHFNIARNHQKGFLMISGSIEKKDIGKKLVMVTTRGLPQST